MKPSESIRSPSPVSPGEPHPASRSDAELDALCDVRFQRRSGPGGQHRNKVETGVYLCHQPTGTTAQATERRSQAENLKAARWRLRLQLALRCRLPWDGPSQLWRERIRGGRIQIGVRHADYPALLAEALDALAAAGWEPKPAAERLGCSPSQLIRFLQREPLAFQRLNQERAERGLRPLK